MLKLSGFLFNILAVVIGVNVRILWRWAFKLFKEMIQPFAFLAHRLQHVIPNSVGAHSVTLLTQMNAVDRHDGQVWLDVALIENARVFEKRLVDNREIVCVELRHETHAFHDLHKSPLELSEEFAVLWKLLSENAGTFDGSAEVARERRANVIHREGQRDQRRGHQVNDGSVIEWKCKLRATQSFVRV